MTDEELDAIEAHERACEGGHYCSDCGFTLPVTELAAQLRTTRTQLATMTLKRDIAERNKDTALNHCDDVRKVEAERDELLAQRQAALNLLDAQDAVDIRMGNRFDPIDRNALRRALNPENPEPQAHTPGSEFARLHRAFGENPK